MIRINLLPHEQRRRKVQTKVPRAAIGGLVLLVVAVMGAVWYVVKQDTERLRAEIVTTQDEITKNRQIIRLVQQSTGEKRQLEDRLALVQRLAAAQRNPVRLLDDISQALPEEAWLNGVSKTSGKLIIRGYAASHFAVAELMLALQRFKPMITSVELSFSEFELFEGRPVERFEIQATLTG